MVSLYVGIVLVCCVLIGLLVWKRFSTGFVLLFPFLYAYAAILASSLYLEVFPSVIYEQGVSSHFNGSTAFLVLLLFFSLISVLFVLQAMSKRFGHGCMARPLFKKSYLCCVLVLEFFLIGHIFLSGSPLLVEGVTRFEFWSDHAIFKPLSIFNWLLYSIVFVVGANGAYFLYKESRMSRFLSFAVLFFAGVYFVSWGNKFSALVLLLFVYYVPGLLAYRVRYGEKYNILKQAFVWGPIFSFIVLFLIVDQYDKFQSRGLDVWDQLIERVLILQGHVWWGSFDRVLAEGGDYEHVLSEFKSLFVDLPKGEAGMTFIMRIIAPINVFGDYFESGVEFTGGFPAINILTLGLLGGGVFTVVSWGGFGFFLFYLWSLIVQGARFRLLLASYIYLNSVVWFQRGSLDGFVNWKTMVVALLIIIVELYRHRSAFGSLSFRSVA